MDKELLDFQAGLVGGTLAFPAVRAVTYANGIRTFIGSKELHEFTKKLIALVSSSEASLEVLLKIADPEFGDAANGWGLPEWQQYISLQVLSCLTRRKPMVEELAEKLSNHPDFIVRQDLAENPTVSREVLLKLRSDKDWGIRDTAEEILEYLRTGKWRIDSYYEQK